MREDPLSDIDYPEDFIPIAAGLQRLPYLSPSAGFADRVISRVERLQRAEGHDLVTAQPRLEVVRGGAVARVPESALVRQRRRQLVKLAVGVPVAAGVLIAVSILFTQLDLLASLLTASLVQMGGVVGVIGTTVGSAVLGDAAMTTLEAGSAQAALLYLVMTVGLISGFSGIRVAAEIAKRKAA